MTRLTVAVFNATGGSNLTSHGRFTTWYDDLECDVAIVSEVFRYRRILRKCGHLRVGSGGHGQQDCGVITKRRPIWWRCRQVTAFIDRPGSDKPLLWHDRWLTRAITATEVVVSSHAPAVIQGRDNRLTDNAGAREWRAHGLPRTEAILARDMKRNRPLIHGGDLNQRHGPGSENPAEMYARLGMNYRSNGVMWVAWNPRRFDLVSVEWLPTPPGSDGHKTALVVLSRINPKEKS